MVTQGGSQGELEPHAGQRGRKRGQLDQPGSEQRRQLGGGLRVGLEADHRRQRDQRGLSKPGLHGRGQLSAEGGLFEPACKLEPAQVTAVQRLEVHSDGTGRELQA